MVWLLAARAARRAMSMVMSVAVLMILITVGTAPTPLLCKAGRRANRGCLKSELQACMDACPARVQTPAAAVRQAASSEKEGRGRTAGRACAAICA